MGIGMRLAACQALSALGYQSRPTDPGDPSSPKVWTHRETGESYSSIDPETLIGRLHANNQEALERLRLPAPLRRRFREAGVLLSVSGTILSAAEASGGPWPLIHAIVQNGPYSLEEMLDWCPLARPDMVFCLVWHVVRLTEDGLDRASELRGRLDALANPATF